MFSGRAREHASDCPFFFYGFLPVSPPRSRRSLRTNIQGVHPHKADNLERFKRPVTRCRLA